MRYLKTPALLASAVAASMVLAAPAMADYITSTTGGAARTDHYHLLSNQHVSLENSIANIECRETTVIGVTVHPVNGIIGAHIDHATLVNCTNSWTVEISAAGTLSVTSTSGHNGTLSSTGATVTAERHTIFGTITCRYATNNTHIGTVTGGNPATLKIEGKIPFHSGGGLCGEGSSQWTGDLTTDSALYVVNS